MAGCFLRNAIRATVLVSTNNISIRPKGFNRYIMTARPRLEKALEELKRNPYFDKYAQKIAKLQQTDPDEFLQRVESEEKKICQKKEQQEREQRVHETQAKPDLKSFSQKQEAQLDKIMKLDMIKDKTREEITEIWKEYHKQKDCICGTMSPEQFNKMFQRGKKYATFLLPLPREQGYEFILTQFYASEVHMTPLLWYQAHKENAPECLTMVYYNELRDSKGLVLMRGEFDKKYISVQEAQCLANELQLYYSMDHPQRLELLQVFTSKPDEFKHMDLVAQLETISFELPEGKNFKTN